MTAAAPDFAKRLDQTAEDTEALLEKLLSDALLPDEIARPKRLMDAMRYSSLGGGKRLRPFLVVESAAVFEVDRNSALLALQRATHATLHLLANELVDLDLTSSEINALANLADGRPRTVSQLAAEVGARPSTLTSVLDRLERRGHISRGTLAGDRRSVLIELTDSGRATAKEIHKAITHIEHRALAKLPAAAVTAFHDVLRALTEVAS